MPMSGSKEQRISIPEAVTFETLNRILVAYLKAGAYEKPVTYKDAATRSGVHPTIVSLNNKFLISSGFLVEETRGSFRLSEAATRYAQLLDWGKTEDAKEPLKELLPKYDFIKTLLDYVSINKKVTKDDLTTKMISILGIQKRARYITGINSLLEMLTYSGLLKEEDGTFSIGLLSKITAERVELRVPPAGTESSPFTKLEKPVIPVSISITVDENTNIEKLKAVIKAIKEVLQEQGNE
jgi:hypothetical protein